MSYKEWFDSHAKKHRQIVDKLLSLNMGKDEIIEYFCYENMVKAQKEFCPLYKENKKCHEMKNLNCYLCACPYFRFDDRGLEIQNGYKVLSRCEINNGDTVIHNNNIHHDCSKCTLPHHKNYIKKVFDFDWKHIMQNCSPDENKS